MQSLKDANTFCIAIRAQSEIDILNVQAFSRISKGSVQSKKEIRKNSITGTYNFPALLN